MSEPTFDFRVHDERLAIARLAKDAAFPAWAQGGFVTISRTVDELSIVCAQRHVPTDVRCERDRIAIGIAGVVPMTTVGLLASLCGALAAARVPVFVISTFDTDWVLVPSERTADASAAWRKAGFVVTPSSLSGGLHR